MNKLFQQRFEELCAQLEAVEKSKKPHRTALGGDLQEFVDSNLFLSWTVKVKDLLSRVCGEDSQYFQQFIKSESSPYTTNAYILQEMKAVFMAAKEDFESGYLTSFRTLVQAEVFDSELEQASELLSNGYTTAAAVVAGVVLETALRELCDRSSIPHAKLDMMNSELVKAGVYNRLVQKRITALADIRNSAAHGKPDEFNRDDVSDMIEQVGRFLIDYL